jgi:hypothetical protein
MAQAITTMAAKKSTAVSGIVLLSIYGCFCFLINAQRCGVFRLRQANSVRYMHPTSMRGRRDAPAESAGVTEGLLNQIAPDLLAPHRARIESQGPKWPSGLQEARGFAPPRPLGLGRREGRNEPVSPAELLARLEETLSCSEVVPAARGSKPSLLR